MITRGGKIPREYRVEVRGVVPRDLGKRVSKLHAHSIQQVGRIKDEKGTQMEQQPVIFSKG